MQTHQHLAGGRAVESRMLACNRCFLWSVDPIYYDIRVTGFCQTRPHLPERRPQTEDVGPDEDAGMFAFLRMHKVSIRCTVRGLDFYFKFFGLGSVGNWR